MTDAESLDLAVTKTGHRRFRELLDPSHPDYDPDYWRVVRELATGQAQPPPPRPSPPSLPPLTLMAAACLYRAQPGEAGCASCRGVRCWANRGNREGGRATTLAHCEVCSGELVPYRRS